MAIEVRELSSALVPQYGLSLPQTLCVDILSFPKHVLLSIFYPQCPLNQTRDMTLRIQSSLDPCLCLRDSLRFKIALRPGTICTTIPLP